MWKCVLREIWLSCQSRSLLQMLVPRSCDLQTNIPHELSLLSVTDIRLPFKSTSIRTLGCLSLWAVFHLITHMTTMNVRVRRFTQYPINTQLLYLRQEAWVIQIGRSSGRKRTQMLRHLLGSFWNHFKLWTPHHWYSYTGEILLRRSQEIVHCGACI